MTSRIRRSDAEDDNETWTEAIAATVTFVLLVVAFCALIVLVAAATDGLPR